MIADLHLHTNESDGTWTPTELVREAAKRGLKAIAITDHDTTGGIEEALRSAPPTLQVIPGVELSCGGPGVENLHVVGLWVEERTTAFQEHLLRMRRHRRQRMEKIVVRLQELGIPIAAADVAQYADRDLFSRSHVASALLALGVVDSKDEAFSRYLDEDAPAYVPRCKLTPEAAVGLILTARGVPVLAHPGLLKDLDALPRLVAAGLIGLEVVHPSHSPPQTKFFIELAQKWNLLPAGGSDCHGPGGKDRIYLGDYTIPFDWVEALAERRW